MRLREKEERNSGSAAKSFRGQQEERRGKKPPGVIGKEKKVRLRQISCSGGKGGRIMKKKKREKDA